MEEQDFFPSNKLPMCKCNQTGPGPLVVTFVPIAVNNYFYFQKFLYRSAKVLNKDSPACTAQFLHRGIPSTFNIRTVIF
jgi:hypothetical protein